MHSLPFYCLTYYNHSHFHLGNAACFCLPPYCGSERYLVGSFVCCLLRVCVDYCEQAVVEALTELYAI
jgi:hypothetical protein